MIKNIKRLDSHLGLVRRVRGNDRLTCHPGRRPGIYTNKNAFSLVEIIVAMAIFIIFAGSATTSILGSYRISKLGAEQSEATAIATEGIEAVQSMRNSSWSNIDVVDGDYNLNNSGDWAFDAPADVINGKYTRVINISSVQRDGGGDIGSGTVDPDTKLITSTVSWAGIDGNTDSVVLTSYLTNWQISMSTVSGNVGGGPDYTSCVEYCSYSDSLNNYTSSVCKSQNKCNADFWIADPVEDYCSGSPKNGCCCSL